MDGQRILPTISKPSDIRDLSYEEIAALAAEIREELIEVTSEKGGHLAPSLGTVEIILALHRVLDCPHDSIVFDVGHQAYAHKLLTGRSEAFRTLRTYEGLCGFPKREESVYDTNNSGHASDSLSTALGLALARDLNGTDERIAVLIGDAALSGGLAFEALNHLGQLGTDLTIVLNDNEMSISRNVGALSLYLGKARLSKGYTRARDQVEGRVGNWGKAGRFLVNAGEAFKGSFKKLVVPGMFFEEMGIKYIGPIDGHSIADMESALRFSRATDGPVLIQAVTRKGAGYAPAEARPDVFHGVGPFDRTTGEVKKSSSAAPKYTEVFSDALIAEAEENEDIVAITAAMTDGTGLATFRTRFPERFFDVGIAEEHAVAMATGLSLGGKIPVVAIYSTFLQRAFDQLLINAALQKQHVVFCLDRAGLVGEDGPTHHGVFDLSYLRVIPNLKIMAPSDEAGLVEALHTALNLEDGPVAIRYPRGNGLGVPIPAEPQIWAPGTSVLRRTGDDVTIFAVGRMVAAALEAADILAARGIEVRVHDMRWVKPLDETAIAQALPSPLVVTMEENTVEGGFGSGVLEKLAQIACARRVKIPQTLVLGIPDIFVPHGAIDRLFGDLGLSAPQVAERIETALTAGSVVR